MCTMASSVAVLAVDIHPGSLGVTATPSGEIAVGGLHDVTVYSSAGIEQWTLERPVGVREWKPRGVTATNSSVLVANWQPEKMGGGIYRYPAQGGTGTLELGCECPRDVVVYQQDRVMLACISGEFGMPATVNVYVRTVPAGDASHWRPTLCRENDDSLYDPRFMTVNPITLDILVTHEKGLTAMSIVDLRNVWSYPCGYGWDGDMDAPRGVCVDKDGLVYLADRVKSRVIVLSGAGDYITTILIPVAAASLQGMAMAQSQAIPTDRHFLVVDHEKNKLLFVYGWEYQLQSDMPVAKFPSEASLTTKPLSSSSKRGLLSIPIADVAAKISKLSTDVHHYFENPRKSENVYQYDDMASEVGIIKIIVDETEKPLGTGCHGTVVYKGLFGGRKVAVKRLQKVFYELKQTEISILEKADQHPNVIRYYTTEEDFYSYKIALELCCGTVRHYVEDEDFDRRGLSTDTLIMQATEGLNHLHINNIVHRDIKPCNILISQPNHYGCVTAKLSDFGISRILDDGRESFSSAVGTLDWRAPEMLQFDNEAARKTRAVDIFSLGCVIHYILSSGLHPFGKGTRIPPNIEDGKYTLVLSDETALDLVRKMISCDIKDRPTTDSVLRHPFCWSREIILQFFEKLSNCMNEEISKGQLTRNAAILQNELNTDGAVTVDMVIRKDWKTHTLYELQSLYGWKNYNGMLVSELVRAIRNMSQHYGQKTPAVQKAIGKKPDGFVDYFTSKFPHLLIHTYRVSVKCGL